MAWLVSTRPVPLDPFRDAIAEHPFSDDSLHDHLSPPDPAARAYSTSCDERSARAQHRRNRVRNLAATVRLVNSTAGRGDNACLPTDVAIAPADAR